MANLQNNELVLRDVRLSYVQLTKPSNRPNQKSAYSVTILLPKTDTAQKAALDAAINAAIALGKAKDPNMPARPKTPIWDGDGYTSNGSEFGPEAKGHWVFTARKHADLGAVEVVDAAVNPIMNPGEIYSGMYANVCVSFYYYNNESKGIGAGLVAVQKTRDGEPLGGQKTAADVFSAAQHVPF